MKRILTLLLCGWVFAQSIRIASLQEFTLDEFTYSHGAWLVSQGLLPYRDFFFHHTPFLLQFLAVLLGSKVAEPNLIFIFRYFMVGAFVIALGASTILNRRTTAWAMVLTPTLLFVMSGFSTQMLEIRLDSFAFALFIAALAIVSSKLSEKFVGAGIVGFAIVLACWTSEKVVFYGLPIWVLFGWECLSPTTNNSVIRNRRGVLCGVAFALALLAYWVLRYELASQCFEWIYRWQLLHEASYPRTNWRGNAIQVAFNWWWIGILALIGIVNSVIGRGIAPSDRKLSVALACSIVTSFLTFSLQRGAFPYSLIPFLGLTGLFAARGVGALLDRVAPLAPQKQSKKSIEVLRLGLTCVGIVYLSSSGIADVLIPKTNLEQRKMLELVKQISAEADYVYDNSGSSVARLSPHYFYFTDRLARRVKGDVLIEEIPTALRERGVMTIIKDRRYPDLPSELQLFLNSHYVEIGSRIALWGIHVSPEIRSRQFEIPRAGVFALCSNGAMDGVTLGEKEVSSRGTYFEPGIYEVRGSNDGKPFTLIWVGRDGRVRCPVEGVAMSLSPGDKTGALKGAGDFSNNS